MTDWNTAVIWLERIKSEHRSSPTGSAWYDFYKRLYQTAPNAKNKPLMPFILAASAESAASKFGRLREQLRWAYDHGVLDDAIRWLDECPLEKWDTCPPHQWGMSFYPTLDDIEDEEEGSET